METKGVIIAVGGNEDKGTKTRRPLHEMHTELEFATSGILCRILSEIDSADAGVDIITSASSEPEKLEKRYCMAFKRLGHRNLRIWNPTSKKEADQTEILDRIAASSCVMFSGGDQFQLTTILRDTELSRILMRRYIHENIVIAGTSAGSMAMADLMIYPGQDPKDTRAKDVTLYDGLSLIRNVIIDTHFLVRSRFKRLAVAVTKHPDHIGIGLEEDTGVIIREGNKIEAIGSGLVTIIDAGTIRYHNKEETDSSIFIENLLVHLLSYGNRYELKKVNLL